MSRLVAPVSNALKAALNKASHKTTTVPENFVELKKSSGPATVAALDQLEVSLAELDKLAVINGVDYSKPIDQFLNWDLLEKEAEPYMPGLAPEIRKMSLAPDALPFNPSIDSLRQPFEDKVAELVRDAETYCRCVQEAFSLLVFSFCCWCWDPFWRPVATFIPGCDLFCSLANRA